VRADQAEVIVQIVLKLLEGIYLKKNCFRKCVIFYGIRIKQLNLHALSTKLN